jgi:integrase
MFAASLFDLPGDAGFDGSIGSQSLFFRCSLISNLGKFLRKPRAQENANRRRDIIELQVRRGVWRTYTNQRKTPESKAVVPVIGPLKKMLDAHRERTGTAHGWIFAGEKKHFALNLDKLARRDIIPKVKERWHGWRRGLSTILFDLGVDPEIASKILRHADSATTRRHYIMLKSRKHGQAAMRKLESFVAQTWPSGKSKSSKSPRKQRSRPT